jgi:MFS superfamily sulfate permease-like transporter
MLMVDYEEHYAIIELIGEWNDAIENDIMTLKRDVIDKFESSGINKFILVAENVLNFHSSDRDYYEEWYEEVSDSKGWIACLNMPQATQYDFKKAKINQYVELIELDNWRIYKPFHLFKKIDNDLNQRLMM